MYFYTNEKLQKKDAHRISRRVFVFNQSGD